MPPRKKAAASTDAESPQTKRSKTASSGVQKRTRKPKKKDDDSDDDFEEVTFERAESLEPEIVLKRVRELAKEERQKNGEKTKHTIQSLGLQEKVKAEVRELDDEQVLTEIERFTLETCRSIMSGDGFAYEVPSRTASNQVYIPEMDRIALGTKTSDRPFASVSTARKVAITTRLLQLTHELCTKRIHCTKRDMFYSDVKLFKEQNESDVILEDMACMIGCTRTSLNVVASGKGVVLGSLIFVEDGDTIDCSQMGVGGKIIPPYMDKLQIKSSNAEFILLIEKDAAFSRLAEDRFYNKYPCIMVTAKGQPDVATRLFLKKLKETLNLPILGLVDSDPYGLKILSVYMSGSKNMSYDSANLTTSDIKWLGVLPSDLDKYNIPAQCRLEMTKEDIETGKRLMEEEFVKKNPQWLAELKLMIDTKQKAEIQSLTAHGFQYLTEKYLPEKIRNGDWI